MIVRFGNFLFRARNFLFPLAFLLLLLTTQPQLLLNNETLDYWMDFFGIIVVAAGQGCRALAVGQAENIRRGGRTRDGRPKQVFAKRLIRHGIYAHTRNPLYLGNLLIVAGLGIVANNPWWYLLVFPTFVGMYWSIVAAEEEFLARQFGQEYTDYLRTVNRFLPSLPGLWRSCAECSFDGLRVIRKEYSVACSWLLMSVGLLIWERWEHFGYAAKAAQIHQLVFVLGGILLGYLILWRLKLAGRLHS
ncbi:MAG: isoprenylcysteine carboxylmethyltransferase family protein [Deltaproteobacteria bacterium]|nr:isoprenylcysteine carboxylmethyltransferase family protein [Deltaproteobacteria bacterium]